MKRQAVWSACLFLLAWKGLAAYPPPVPSSLVLTVRETEGVARSGEVVRSGVPVPRSLGLLNTAGLTVVDAAGVPVPAELQVLARWNAGPADAAAPIQWLLVTFPATVAGGAQAVFRIVLDGSAGPNPSPANPLVLTRSGNQVTVETGAATFVLGGNAGALFDEIRLAGGARLVSGGMMSVRVGSDSGHTVTRSVRVEHAGALSAAVVVEGQYGTAPVGGGGLGSVRRYVFTAGSPVAVVRQVVQWEGDRCGAGNLSCGGSPNGVRVEQVRDALALDLGFPRQVRAVGSFTAPAVDGAQAAGQAASVRQRQRAARTEPLSFEVVLPGLATAGGQKADGGMLAVGTPAGAVVAALDHLHRYEPQALRLLADGRLAVDLADGSAWLGSRQGLFATLAVGVFPALPSRAELDRRVWVPLNHPLRAWPAADWWAASGAVDEMPAGPLPADLARYDTLVQGVLDTTLAKIDEKGIAGLMTFGLYPREWGRWFDELDCGGGDPTPGETWDNAYWCGTWTDYHNTLLTAAVRAERTGEVRWLDEIGEPGALRTLYTQIQRCGPADSWFYCGQAPAGYGGYRADFNSSHAYFENLFLHYWLTGDSTVLDTLRRGASSMRNYLCSRRPAAPCLPTDPPADEWAHLTGRVAVQWFEVFHFLGLAEDPSYLDDWRSGLARAATQNYVQPRQAGRSYGFWLYGGDPVNGPGTDSTDQLWMISLYDMNTLHRLQRETLNAPVGSPALTPNTILASWARTLAGFGPLTAPGGDGTASGNWPNALFFTWSGSRVDGALTGVTANLSGGDPLLYGTGKSCLTAALLRATDDTGDPLLLSMGAALTQQALNDALAELQPLNKFQGEYLSRLHTAVARLAAHQPAATPASFFTLTPCRLFDTRDSTPLTSGVSRLFPIAGRCGIPPTARSVVVTLTVVGPTGQGHVVVYPGDATLPGTSSLNFTAGVTRANNAVLPLSADGAGTLAVQATVLGGGQTHLILDVSGYFQ